MATFLDNLLPSVHDTLTLREALSKLAGKQFNFNLDD
jgi:hypothetical protein